MRLAAQADDELVAGRPAHTAELVVSLPARPGAAGGGGKRSEANQDARGGGNKGAAVTWLRVPAWASVWASRQRHLTTTKQFEFFSVSARWLAAIACSYS